MEKTIRDTMQAWWRAVGMADIYRLLPVEKGRALDAQEQKDCNEAYRDANRLADELNQHADVIERGWTYPKITADDPESIKRAQDWGDQSANGPGPRNAIGNPVGFLSRPNGTGSSGQPTRRVARGEGIEQRKCDQLFGRSHDTGGFDSFSQMLETMHHGGADGRVPCDDDYDDGGIDLRRAGDDLQATDPGHF